MKLKHLSRTQLDERLQGLVARERELLHEMLLTIQEISMRRLYLEFGYPSLFAYLTERMGLSAGSAQRRIEALRLLREIPSVGEKIATGELNLQQITLVQKTAREAVKQQAKTMTSSEKEELIGKLVGLNLQDSQKQVAAFFELPISEGTRQKFQADESVRVEMTLSKELYEKIQQAQSLLSHAVGSRDLVDYLAYVTERVIRQKTATSTVEVKPAAVAPPRVGRGFSQRAKKLVHRRDRKCQYQDPRTGRVCGSRWFLQVDHRHSRWAGGADTLENAQLLCAGHNQMKYRRESGQA